MQRFYSTYHTPADRLTPRGIATTQNKVDLLVEKKNEYANADANSPPEYWYLSVA